MQPDGQQRRGNNSSSNLPFPPSVPPPPSPTSPTPPPLTGAPSRGPWAAHTLEEPDVHRPHLGISPHFMRPRPDSPPTPRPLRLIEEGWSNRGRTLLDTHLDVPTPKPPFGAGEGGR